MKKLIVFDFDGVLINSVEFWFQVNKMAAKVLKRQLSRKTYLDSFLGNIHSGLAKNLKLNAEEEEKIFKIKNELVEKLYSRKKLKFFDQAEVLLKQLNKQADLCIVTSSPKKSVHGLLLGRGLRGMFKEIYGLNRKGKRLVLAGLAKKYSTGNIIFVTDTVGDIKEGIAAGLRTCAVSWGFHKKKLLLTQKPNFLATNFDQLLKLLLKYIEV